MSKEMTTKLSNIALCAKRLEQSFKKIEAQSNKLVNKKAA